MTLASRWHRVWGEATAADPRPRLEVLLRAYAQPHRVYHTMEHVASCLAHFDEVRELASDPLAVELAIWLHDVVYRTWSGNNERASARLARRWLRRDGAPGTLVERVPRLVLATRHESPPQEADERLLCDIDLAILGAPPAEFADYEARIRREYGKVPDFVYRRRRPAVLEGLRARPTLFATEAFRQRFEDRARRNLEALIRSFR